MNHEVRQRPRSLFARFRNLLSGMFSLWVRESEIQNPRAVYEQAIHEKTKQYHQLKEAVAGILYRPRSPSGAPRSRGSTTTCAGPCAGATTTCRSR